MELSKITECEPMPEYHQALAEFFVSQDLVMTEFDDSRGQVVDINAILGG